MEDDKASDPSRVRLFRPQTQVTDATDAPNFVEKTGFGICFVGEHGSEIGVRA